MYFTYALAAHWDMRMCEPVRLASSICCMCVSDVRNVLKRVNFVWAKCDNERMNEQNEKKRIEKEKTEANKNKAIERKAKIMKRQKRALASALVSNLFCLCVCVCFFLIVNILFF